VTRRREVQAKASGLAVVAGPLEGEDRFATASLIGANLFPLFGVIFLGWDAGAIVLLYWAENLIAGFYTAARMALVAAKPSCPHLAKLFFIPFFCFHFGGFCTGHGVFLGAFFHLGDMRKIGDLDWPGPLFFLGLPFSVAQQLFPSMPADMIWALVALFISHGVSFVENYLLRGEYRTAEMGIVMVRPYPRMALLHVAIIFGGFFIMSVGSPIPLLAILVILKLGLDFCFHRWANRPTGQGSGQDIET